MFYEALESENTLFVQLGTKVYGIYDCCNLPFMRHPKHRLVWTSKRTRPGMPRYPVFYLTVPICHQCCRAGRSWQSCVPQAFVPSCTTFTCWLCKETGSITSGSWYVHSSLPCKNFSGILQLAEANRSSDHSWQPRDSGAWGTVLFAL